MFKDCTNRDIQVGDIISMTSPKSRQRVMDLDANRGIIYYREQGSDIVWAGDWNYYKDRTKLVSSMSLVQSFFPVLGAATL